MHIELEISHDLTTAAVLGIGFAVGLRHALDADHLAAVSAIVSERRSLFGSTVVGAMWGAGHTIALLLVGAVAIVFKLSIPNSVEGYLEAGVGLMLILLGLNVFRKLLRAEIIHSHEHTHKGVTHTHPHTHASEPASAHHVLHPRSVVVGMIHGLAGSAGLLLLVVPTIASASLALMFILVFGVGSIIGMSLMSLLIGMPIYLTSGKYAIINTGLKICAGVFSFGVGGWLLYDKLLNS
jgi:hypothetical protein